MTAKIFDAIFSQGFPGLLNAPGVDPAKAKLWNCIRMCQINGPLSEAQFLERVNSKATNPTVGNFGYGFDDNETKAAYDWNSADKPPNSFPGTQSTLQYLLGDVNTIKGYAAKNNVKIKTGLYSYCSNGSVYGGFTPSMYPSVDKVNVLAEMTALADALDWIGDEHYAWSGADSPDSTAARQAYATRATRTAANSRTLAKGKAICAFVFGRRGDGNDGSGYGPLLEPGYFGFMLRTLYPLYDYIIVWYGSGIAFNKAEPWYSELATFLSTYDPGTGNGNLVPGDGGVTPPPTPGQPDNQLALASKSVSGVVNYAAESSVTAPPAGFAGMSPMGMAFKAAGAGLQPLYRAKSSDGRYGLICQTYNPGSGWNQESLIGYVNTAAGTGLQQLTVARTPAPATLLLWYGVGAPPPGYQLIGTVAGVFVASGVVPPPVDQSKAIGLLGQANTAIVGSVPVASANIALAVKALS